jgi:hypothetical protein
MKKLLVVLALTFVVSASAQNTKKDKPAEKASELTSKQLKMIKKIAKKGAFKRI